MALDNIVPWVSAGETVCCCVSGVCGIMPRSRCGVATIWCSNYYAEFTDPTADPPVVASCPPKYYRTKTVTYHRKYDNSKYYYYDWRDNAFISVNDSHIDDTTDSEDITTILVRTEDEEGGDGKAGDCYTETECTYLSTKSGGATDKTNGLPGYDSFSDIYDHTATFQRKDPPDNLEECNPITGHTTSTNSGDGAQYDDCSSILADYNNGNWENIAPHEDCLDEDNFKYRGSIPAPDFVSLPTPLPETTKISYPISYPDEGYSGTYSLTVTVTQAKITWVEVKKESYYEKRENSGPDNEDRNALTIDNSETETTEWTITLSDEVSLPSPLPACDEVMCMEGEEPEDPPTEEECRYDCTDRGGIGRTGLAFRLNEVGKNTPEGCVKDGTSGSAWEVDCTVSNFPASSRGGQTSKLTVWMKDLTVGQAYKMTVIYEVRKFPLDSEEKPIQPSGCSFPAGSIFVEETEDNITFTATHWAEVYGECGQIPVMLRKCQLEDEANDWNTENPEQPPRSVGCTKASPFTVPVLTGHVVTAIRCELTATEEPE